MSVLTIGLAVDFEREERSEMAITSLWPAAVSTPQRGSLTLLISCAHAIDSAATQGSSVDRAELRKPSIFSDAILAILNAPTKDVSGRCLLDEDFLREKGETDFSKYNLVEGSSPRRIMPAELPDLRVAEQDDEGRRADSTEARKNKL